MVPLSATEFAMAEGQRVQFAPAGPSMELRLMNPDGTHVAFAREK